MFSILVSTYALGSKRSLWVTGAIVLLFSNAGYSTEKANISSCLYSALLLKIGAAENVTALRRELKTVVSVREADSMVSYVIQKLGKDRVQLRDVPPHSNDVFVTDTDYLPAFRGWENGKLRHSGVIRIRHYLVTSKYNSVKNVDRMIHPDSAKLADGDQDQEFAKLEFKVGHPEFNSRGILEDLDGVVDKPGIVLPRADIDALLASKKSFLENREAIIRKAESLKLTTVRRKPPRTVNNREDVAEMIDRIGKMHEAALSDVIAKPEVNIRYIRVARKLDFTPDLSRLPAQLRDAIPTKFELQLTIDRQVRIKDLVSNKTAFYGKDDRVVELKIPLPVSTFILEHRLSDLRKWGMGDLADVYERYVQLPVQPGFRVNSGKRAKGVKLLESEVHDRWLGIAPPIEEAAAHP